MNPDALYSYLIDLTWFFLTSWIVLLATAYVMAFNDNWLQRITRGLR